MSRRSTTGLSAAAAAGARKGHGGGARTFHSGGWRRPFPRHFPRGPRHCFLTHHQGSSSGGAGEPQPSLRPPFPRFCYQEDHRRLKGRRAGSRARRACGIRRPGRRHCSVEAARETTDAVPRSAPLQTESDSGLLTQLPRRGKRDEAQIRQLLRREEAELSRGGLGTPARQREHDAAVW